tara:strand:+ start:968 stop:1396 length:429 start_codon:yes stop_codon:yes gene_type:complete
MSDHEDSGADVQINKLSTATVKFVPPFQFSSNNEAEPECIVTINVNETPKYYYINYEYRYENTSADMKTGIDHPAHPFSKDRMPLRHASDMSYGVEVIKNEVTKSMVTYILMSDDELSLYTGNNTPMRYRNDLMISLGLLWD